MAKKTIREIIMEDAKLRKDEEKKGWYIFTRSTAKSGYVKVGDEYVNVLGPATDADVDDVSHSDEIDGDVFGPFPSKDAAMKKAGLGKKEEGDEEEAGEVRDLKPRAAIAMFDALRDFINFHDDPNMSMDELVKRAREACLKGKEAFNFPDPDYPADHDDAGTGATDEG